MWPEWLWDLGQLGCAAELWPHQVPSVHACGRHPEQEDLYLWDSKKKIWGKGKERERWERQPQRKWNVFRTLLLRSQSSLSSLIWKGATSSASKWPLSILYQLTCLVWRKERSLGLTFFFVWCLCLFGPHWTSTSTNELKAQPPDVLDGRWTLWHNFPAHFLFCT